MEWKIGNITIKNQVALAPMAGVTSPTYIKICEEMAVGYAVTELISAEAIVRQNAKTFEMLKGLENLNIPYAIQIFGSNPKTMAKASQILVEEYKAPIIDINMGCPVPKVAIKNNAGSSLMKEPEKVKEIVASVVNSVNVPVTVKIRSGWDDEHKNAPLIAQICEQTGAKAIFIHARTRKQGYSGNADWNIIKKVKESVSIPVIGNGDIKSCYDAKRMLIETHCDAVMIGRASLGNPWLIKECVQYLENEKKPDIVSLDEKITLIKRLINDITREKGDKNGILELRTLLMYFLKGMPNTKEIKLAICKCQSKKELLKIIDTYLKNEE